MAEGYYNGLIDKFLASGAPHKTRLKVQEGIDVCREALAQYGFSNLAISFNGGKDCLVMLYLILAVLEQNNLLESDIPTVYIRTDHTFPEVDDFVDECAKRYHLSVDSITKPMKPALENYLDNHNDISAIFVGIRRADPFTKDLKFIQRTDAGWPDFMRIHPVLEWEYDDIWIFLRELEIPYCVLYDQGYTSLGSTTSTVRNPDLKREDGSYQPAYSLTDNTLERVGRMKSPKCP